MTKDEYEEALGFFKEVIEADPESPAAYYCAGCIYQDMNREDEAVESFEKVLELDENYRNTLHKLFVIYRRRYQNKNRKADYEKALHYVNKDIEYSEDNDPYFYRALIYDDAMAPAHNLALRELYNKYSDRGFEVYQISLDANEHFWKTSADKLPWICVRDANGQYSKFVSLYNVTALPSIFLMGRDNELKARGENVENIEEAIVKLL